MGSTHCLQCAHLQIRISNIGIPEEGWYTCEAEATDGSDEIVTLTQAPFYLAICGKWYKECLTGCLQGHA